MKFLVLSTLALVASSVAHSVTDGSDLSRLEVRTTKHKGSKKPSGPKPLNKIQQVQLTAMCEDMQNAMITAASKQFSVGAFAAAGYKAEIRQRMVAFQTHDNAHIPIWKKYLTSVNATMPEPCEWEFPISTLNDWVAMSKLVEQIAHNSRFQPDVVPLYGGDTTVPPIIFNVDNGISINSFSLYRKSCPSDGKLDGVSFQPPPVASVAKGAKPTWGAKLAFTYPPSAYIAKSVWSHVVVGPTDTATPVKPANGKFSATLPKKYNGLVWVSVTESSDTQGYSGPSDTNLDLAPIALNPGNLKCKAPFVCPSV